MKKIIFLPFYFQERQYYTLVRITKSSADLFQVSVTIMDSDLQGQIKGGHFYMLQNGKIEMHPTIAENEPANIKLKIIETLNHYFEIHPIE